MTDMPGWRAWAEMEHKRSMQRSRPMASRKCPHCGKVKFCTAKTMSNHRYRCRRRRNREDAQR